MLGTELFELKESFISERTWSRIVTAYLESKWNDREIKSEQEIKEKQNTARHTKLDKCMSELKSQLDEEYKCSEQYRIHLIKAIKRFNQLQK